MNVNQKFKIKQFEWFQMQTKVRQMVQEILGPIQKRILQHSTNLIKIKQSQQTDCQKVEQLTMMVTNDPTIFQRGIFKQVDQRFQVHEKRLQEVRRLIQQSNNFVQKKFQLLDLRMRQSNQSMLNFTALKQRVHKQIQIQNDNIQKLRANFEKMIQKVGQEITQTNNKIVQNLLVSQKMDKSLQQRIRVAQMQIMTSRQAIQNNKQLIMDKNVQMQCHQFKIQKIHQKLKDLQIGQSISQRLEQYIKDMEISIKKCEFRVEAVTPLVTMAQIQQALEYILPEKLRKRVIIFGYKKYSKLNRQILDKKYDQAKEKFNGIDLVEAMQKKNTREITSLKRKKIISMGIDIDHLTFEARQRYYQEVDMDQLSQQQQDNQNNAKIDQAQILNLVSLYFNEFTTDVSQKVKNQLQDTKAYVYGMESELKKQMEMNQQIVKKSQQHCLKFHRDQMLQMKAAQNQLGEAQKGRKEVLEWLIRAQQVEKKFYNFCSLINHLQIQEQIDKQNISLMGIQENKKSLEKGQNVVQKNSIIEIQKNCFSCCGYPASALSSFKMACLAYHPSHIVIDEKQYRRQDILQFTTNILQNIKGNLQINVNNECKNNQTNNNNLNKLQKTITYRNQKNTIDPNFDSLQKLGNSCLQYSPIEKTKFQQTTTINQINSKLTMKDPQEMEGQKKNSSVRLRKSVRREITTTNQKHKINSHTKSHSNSMSKEMVTVTNNFLDLKKRHLSFLS